VERLYLSPGAQLDGVGPIRGGVPVCFPQFNQRGNLPKHGFARVLPWQLKSWSAHADCAELSLALTESAATQALWPCHFELVLALTLTPGRLHMRLTLHNRGDQVLTFTGALHSYLRLHALEDCRLSGLGAQSEWDAVRDTHGLGAQALRFDGEFDRVYRASLLPLELDSGQSRLSLTQGGGWSDTVVWNPGAQKCAQLADMPPDGYRHMLCVEAARVFEPAQVEAGASWQGWQALALA